MGDYSYHWFPDYLFNILQQSLRFNTIWPNSGIKRPEDHDLIKQNLEGYRIGLFGDLDEDIWAAPTIGGPLQCVLYALSLPMANPVLTAGMQT